MEVTYKATVVSIFLLLLTQRGRQLDVVTLDHYLLKSFQNGLEPTSFNHFTVSEDGRRVYLGGVGILYHLTRDFDALANVSTGVNNTNKILSIAPEPVNKLISCGSGLNGMCQLRYLDNLTDTGDQTLSLLKVTEDENTTLGLVVNHPPGVAVSQALYVAKSIGKGGDGPMQSRCLSKLDGSTCNVKEDDKQTVHIASSVTHNFFIKVAASFSYNGYTYFFSSQLLDATDNTQPNVIVPKLSRVCQTDSSMTMDGFTEITLECRGIDNTLYTIVQSAVVVDDQLFAVFVKNDGDTNFDPANKSALCVYDMKNLTQEFDTTTTACACDDGGVFSNNNYLTGSHCRTVPIKCDYLAVIDLTCDISTGNVVFARYPERAANLGFLPGEIVFEHSGETFTSILITETVVQNAVQKVAFIGSQEGHIMKVQFSSTQIPGVLYEKLDVQYPVLSDTWLGSDSIMVLTERKMLELSIANCSRHQTCHECLNGDPHCGWCILKNRCTRSTECFDSDDWERWLPFSEYTCLNIAASPENISFTLSGTHNITIDATFLPVHVNCSCHFGDVVTPAHRISDSVNSLVCLTPYLTNIPDIVEGEHVVVKLALSSSEYNVIFGSVPFYFFDCSRISGCKRCHSEWNCVWSVNDFQCRYDSTTSYASQSQPQSCAMILSGDTYIHSGANREISLTVETPSATSVILNKEYECVVTYSGKEIMSETRTLSSSDDTVQITCAETEYSYSSAVQLINASLRIRLKGSDAYLDGRINVILYKCEVDRPDCSRCLPNITTPPVFNCGWCSSQSTCTVSENCGETIQQQCTDPPTITSI